MSQKLKFPNFSQAKVLVIGDIMLDRYWHGPTERISPEAPIPVVKVSESEERIGGAGNVALNLASLGCGVDLLGLVGKDEAAQTLKNKLAAAEVNCRFEEIPGGQTTTKLRVISRHQQLVRLDFEESLANELALKGLKQSFGNNLEDAKVIVASDYAKGALENVSELIAIANKKNIPVVVDPKGSDFEKYRGAYLLTPNLGEFEAVVGKCDGEADLVEKGLRLIDEYQLQALLITRSENGMTLLVPGKPELHLPAHASEVFDVTGAGDTVIATLAGSLAAGESLESATSLANVAAGVVVQKLGTAAISPHELRREIRLDDESGKGVVSVEQLQIMIEDSKSHDEKVVMTNGCFDIIHAGHVSYLNEAKSLGDRLIVAVNSDDSVKRLKGEDRPINPLERRMAVLAGLESVDWVVSFSEDTPADLVSKLLPDILVKGGDWKAEEIAGGEAVIANGGQVMSLSFENGCSTTAIIDLIKEREQS